MTGPIRAATRRATMTVRMSVERRNCFGLRPAAVYRRIHHKQGMTSARISGQRVSNVNRMTRRAVLETEMELEEWGIPLLSQEGWREAPGWFHKEPPLAGSLRNPAALLTQEGNVLVSKSFTASQIFLHQEFQVIHSLAATLSAAIPDHPHPHKYFFSS